MITLYNTRTHKVEKFIPLHNATVGIYSCGPTVYDYQHIGHMRRYVGDDVLLRVLKYNGYYVHHVMNITDVGHLVSDADSGEDKMEKGAKKFGKTVWDIANIFEQQFKDSCKELNIQLPKELMHATDYIKEQITLIQRLEKKGFTYKTSDGIYFDISKFPDYFKLSRQNPKEFKKGARVAFMDEKRNVSDFALWKFSPKNEKRQMEWESPWGIGFPGWHIECSAMSMKALGESFDIHTGGIDHIAIHHTNEIAQAEAATGKQFVKYWVHHNFLTVEGQKMSKSLGNFYTVQDVIKKDYDPMALRYLYMQTHYRQEMNFTWEALEAAQTSLKKLRNHVTDDPPIAPNITWIQKCLQAMHDDINTAKALAVTWEMVKDENLSAAERSSTLVEIDTILGLDLEDNVNRQSSIVKVPKEIQEAMHIRERFRKAGDFAASDEIRKKIQDAGYDIKDTKEGPEITKKHD